MTVLFLLSLLAGAALVVAGLAMIYPPVAFIAAGLALLRLAREAAR